MFHCSSCGHRVHQFGPCAGNCGTHWTRDRAQRLGLIEAEAFGGFGGSGLGVDLGDGDLVENLGDGLGIDLETGDVELEIAPGLDIDLDRGDAPFGW